MRNDFVINNLFSCLYVIFSFVTSSLYLVVLDWKIFLVIIVLQPISLIVQMIISPVITRYSKESREVVSKYIQSVQEMFMNPVGLLLSGMRKQIENRVLYRQKESYKASKKIFVISTISSHVAEILRTVTVCAVIAYGGYSIISGRISLGVLVVFITYTQKIITNIEGLWNLSIDYSEIKPIYERVNGYYMHEDNSKDRGLQEMETPSIVFNHVTFSYDGVDIIYDDLNYSFLFGTKYGIVGKTGEGKSTLIKLISGLWKVNSGEIVFGGTNVKNLNIDTVNDVISYLSNDALIIHDSIFNNIALGNEDITYDDVCMALKKACLYDEVENMKDGLDSIVGNEGSVLSSGQRQRLLLARIFANASKKIIILDEPTSALDKDTQEIVMNTIYEEFRDRTLIIITHDKAILSQCEKILLLENGKLIER